MDEGKAMLHLMTLFPYKSEKYLRKTYRKHDCNMSATIAAINDDLPPSHVCGNIFRSITGGFHKIFRCSKKSVGHARKTESRTRYEEEFYEVNIGDEFAKNLTEKFSDSLSLPTGFQPVIQIPVALGRQLYAAYVESVFQQQEAHDQMLAKTNKKDKHESTFQHDQMVADFTGKDKQVEPILQPQKVHGQMVPRFDKKDQYKSTFWQDDAHDRMGTDFTKEDKQIEPILHELDGQMVATLTEGDEHIRQEKAHTQMMALFPEKHEHVEPMMQSQKVQGQMVAKRTAKEKRVELAFRPEETHEPTIAYFTNEDKRVELILQQQGADDQVIAQFTKDGEFDKKLQKREERTDETSSTSQESPDTLEKKAGFSEETDPLDGNAALLRSEQPSTSRRQRTRKHQKKKNVHYQQENRSLKENRQPSSSFFVLARDQTRRIAESYELAAKPSGECDEHHPDKNTLDLHYLHVKEAIQALDTFLDKGIRSLREEGLQTKSLIVITGRGKHSPDRIPRIKPAVKERLGKRCLKYSQINPGRLKIHVFKDSSLTNEVS